MAADIPQIAQDAVLVQSGKLPVESVKVQGYDFNNGVNYHELLKSFRTTGFQATNFGLAVEEIDKMVCIFDVARNIHYSYQKCPSWHV